MANTCSICRHSKRKEIESALAAGQSLRDIAGRFQVGKSSVERHAADCIPYVLSKARREREFDYAVNINDEMKRAVSRINKLFDACQDYLIDAETGAYYLGPRSEDITVFYEAVEDGKVARKKAPLSELLAKIESQYW
jgi:hypothetical protein